MDMLRPKNELTVGNAPGNARGDELGPEDKLFPNVKI